MGMCDDCPRRLKNTERTRSSQTAECVIIGQMNHHLHEIKSPMFTSLDAFHLLPLMMVIKERGIMMMAPSHPQNLIRSHLNHFQSITNRHHHPSSLHIVCSGSLKGLMGTFRDKWINWPPRRRYWCDNSARMTCHHHHEATPVTRP